MAGKFHHELIYRGQDVAARLSGARLAICGAGALGSNLIDNLARQGFGHIRVIDCDRVEEHNIGTQVYGEGDIGGWKVEILRNRMFRAVGIEIDGVNKRLDDRNASRLLKGFDVVVDTFDNSQSRSAVQRCVRSLPNECLHVGLSADYGEVVWDENYRVPRDTGQDVCDYPLARNQILITMAVASETLLAFLLHGRKGDWSITLGDFSVRPLSKRVDG